MRKVLLYYLFTPVADPEAVRLWQIALCEGLDLRGRIIVSEHGINGAVCGDIESCRAYVRRTREYQPFHDLEVKWSSTEEQVFPRLRVKVRAELVSFGAPGELRVDEHGVVGGGRHLSPAQVDQLVAERGDEVVFFDGRNAFEAEVGHFAGAVVPPVEHTRDFVEVLDRGDYDDLKHRPIVTYCTGGIRCEVLSALMRARGFDEVYQIDGGIVRYGEQRGDDGLWQGSLYVFDDRKTITFSDHAAQVGRCALTGAPTTTYYDLDRLPDDLVTALGHAPGDVGQVLLCDDVVTRYAKAR